LRKECDGTAHHTEGFVFVSDVKIMRERVSDEGWGYEVLCKHEHATKSVENASSGFMNDSCFN
jgi:hypothetical protein